MNKIKVKRWLCFIFAVMFVFFSLISSISAFADGEDESITANGEANDNLANLNSEESSVAELDKFTYSGNDLGASYTKEATTFKVWSPTATKIQVLLYATGSDDEKNSKYISVTDMEYDEQTGVWTAVIEGDLLNKYYTYYVYNGKKGKETVDIYAKAVGVNGNRGMIVDLESTNPDGWNDDKHVTVEKQSDAIVWEVNVKDFSNDPSSGISEKNRGKYLAFTENGSTLDSSGYTSTGIDYLKELGVNYVQLMPVFDFGSVDESKADIDQFNWGYDPKNYNVPEGSYSSNPYDGNVRINEFKQMVQSIHNNGMGVIMDVVYNHTYEGAKSWFNITVPNYYYRFTESGTWSNGSGCGNDTASEHNMFRKYMIDSIVYWATEYHIDGFRFDLMGLHDVDTMNAIRAALDQIDGGDKIIMYGEGWSLNTSAEPGTILATQQNMSKMDARIGAFNDGIRDGIKGSNFNAAESGYIQGGQGASKVKSGIKAEIDSWSKAPTQTVTYVSCHDNYTLWDKLVATSGDFENYSTRDERLVSMNKLSAAILMTSQGISFFQAGEEFARTKKGDENSYKSSSKINQLDWSRRCEYSDLVQYYAGLIDIRKNYAPFTDATDVSAKSISFLSNMPKGVIAYTMRNNLTVGEQWDKVALIFNSTDTDQEIKISGDDLPEEWVVVVNGDSAGLNGLSVITDSVANVKAGTAMMLVDKSSFDSVGLKSDKGTVTVNYVDQDSGETIKKQVISGTVGKSYSIKPDSSVSLNYTFKSSKGPVNGKYTDDGAEVTLYYTKYNGTYGKVKISFVDGETGNELAEAVTQSGRTGDRYYTAELPTITGYAIDLTDLPDNGSGKYTDGEIEVVYKYNSIKNESVTVHYYNSNNWDNLTLYAYGNGEQNGKDTKEILGAWPGKVMKDDGDGWWSYTIPASEMDGIDAVRVIFANGNAQDPLAGNEGYLVSGEVCINNGVIADAKGKEFVYTGKVNVFYVDNTGAIIDKDVLTGDVNTAYNAPEKSFFGYEAISNSDNVAGYFTPEEINVIFNYRPNYGNSLIIWLSCGGVAVLAGGLAAFIVRKRNKV